MTDTVLESCEGCSNDLLCCPFCGTKELYFYPDGDMEGHSIMGDHKENCPMGTFGYITEDEAIKAWNKRAT